MPIAEQTPVESYHRLVDILVEDGIPREKALKYVESMTMAEVHAELEKLQQGKTGTCVMEE